MTKLLDTDREDCMIVNFHMSHIRKLFHMKKLHDGTLKLTIEAVWEIRMLDKAITSELIIKPMKDGSFQYLSNKVIKSDQNANAGWYMPRLTEEEWKANYSNN